MMAIPGLRPGRGLLPALPALVWFSVAAAAGPCGDHAWCDPSLSPDERTTLLLAEMTLDEKLSLMGGDDFTGVFTGEPATGTSDGIPRLGIPTVYFNDGPAGVRKGASTAMPAPLGLAAAWSETLATEYGAVIGDEARKKGIHVVHAPAVNIVRVPHGGRSFEYYGEDPYLAARTAVGFTRGLQAQGVAGNVKHYAVNNQETDRFVTNAIVDERTLREIYLPAFEATVGEAGIGSVMLSYNRVNGRFATENAELVNGILKRDFGFEGFALTDYGFAQHGTADSANAGNDLEMPQAFWFSPPMLQLALATGQVSESVIDGAVARILRTMFRFGMFDDPPVVAEPDYDAHALLAREIGEQTITLLQNDGILPLDAGTISSIAVIGPKADQYRSGGGSSNVTPSRAPVTPLAGIRARAGSGVTVTHDPGYVPLLAAEAARAADVAIVVVNDNQTEFVDRPCLGLFCGDPTSGLQDTLVAAVADANPRTIVLLETGGAVLMPWIEEVAAVVEAWYPGQEGGHAIARVLFGDVDPGGRLPVTFPRKEGDTAVGGRPERYPGIAFNALYSEGVFVGYRHFDQNGIDPLFAFGHGLSYTAFAYENLVVSPASGGGASVELTVRNDGARTGTEVVQLYVGLPEPSPSVSQPPRALKGFAKIELASGEAAAVRFDLDPRSLSYWDTVTNDWRVAPGCYEIHVGRSSRDLRLHGEIGIGGACGS